MQLVTKYPEAIFSWVDLSTTDAAGAKSFYTALFGWEADDRPLPGGGHYTMMQIDGHDVCGMGQMSDEQIEQGMPPVWVSYVNVDDLEAAVASASEAGAAVFLPPMDVMEAGRMAMLQDPTGAAFAFWKAKEHIGAAVVNQPNSLVWNELATQDADAARAFYTDVLGWDYSFDENNNYHMFFSDGRAAAGMMQMTEEWGDMPSHWMVYFRVEDIGATVEKARSLGGNVHVPPTEIPGTGTFSVILDPQGAVFTVMQMNQVDPPPGH